MERIKESISIWIAWHLPKRVITWCFSRVFAHATQGKYSNQIAPELTAVDALDRWNK